MSFYNMIYKIRNHFFLLREKQNECYIEEFSIYRIKNLNFHVLKKNTNFLSFRNGIS